jgi:D-alanine-D-alanine ligase
MRIGLAFSLKTDGDHPDRPDDWQEEFDSPATVAALADVLRAAGHAVAELGDGRPLIERLLADPPDLVFNIAEGCGAARSREARVPAVCEMLGIPYTGSDPLALAVSLDKDLTRRLVAAAGVPVPAGFAVAPGGHYDPDAVPYPAIVKPAWEGSSKGVRGPCIVHNPAELAERVASVARDYRQPVMVEEFIAGEEVTAAVLGNTPPRLLGLMRIVPKRPSPEFIYSLEVKRDWEARIGFECPPRFDPEVLSVIEYNALTAFRALGCRDVARVDFRVRDGVPYFLEINPLPGLNPVYGDIVIIARYMGLTHPELVRAIVQEALERNS